MNHLAIPSWIFERERFPAYYLLCLHANGEVSVDGDHNEPEDVAQAKRLFESIAVIRPKPGARYMMLTVQEVPDVPTEVNEEAISVLNANLHGCRD